MKLRVPALLLALGHWGKAHEKGLVTVVNITSTLGAVYMTFRNTPKLMAELDALNVEGVTSGEKVRAIAPIVAAPVILTGLAIGSSVLGYKIMRDMSGSIQTLTNALSIAQLAKNERKEAENLAIGEGTSDKVDEAVAKKHAEESYKGGLIDNGYSVISTGHGQDLFFDDWSGRWFYSDINFIKAKINDLNYQLMNDLYISVNEYYEALDLDPIGAGEELGWNVDYGMLDMQYFAKLDDADRVYTVLKFRNEPCAKWDTRNRW